MQKHLFSLALLSLVGLSLPVNALLAADHVRARDLGVPFWGEPGPLNAITDVAGIEVGHSTIIRGEAGGGEPVVRTGVTARGCAGAMAVRTTSPVPGPTPT